jgi:hypothetical protein
MRFHSDIGGGTLNPPYRRLDLGDSSVRFEFAFAASRKMAQQTKRNSDTSGPHNPDDCDPMPGIQGIYEGGNAPNIAVTKERYRRISVSAFASRGGMPGEHSRNALGSAGRKRRGKAP